MSNSSETAIKREFEDMKKENDILFQLKEINKRRCKLFGHELNDWDMPRWGNAVAGEVGEMCNIIKKIDRGIEYKSEFANKVAIQSLSYEAADIVIYLDLLCQRAGIDLREAIKEKFNKVSERLVKDSPSISNPKSFFIK